MRKLFTICISIIIVMCINSIPALAVTGTRNLTLDDAVKRAQNQNSGLMLLYQKLAVANDRYDQATSSSDLEKKQKAIDDLVNQIDGKKKELEVNITRLYHQVLIKQKQVSLQGDIVNRLTKEYESKKMQVDLGKDTETNLITAEMNKSDAESKLLDMQGDLDNTIMDLNNEMGDDLGQKLNLRDEPIPEDTLDIKDLDKLASDMVDKSYSIESIEEDIHIAQHDVNSADPDTKAQAQDKVADLSFQLSDEKASIGYKVRSDYNTVLNKKDDAEIKRLDYEKKTKLADASRIRYGYGFITSMEYDRADQDAKGAMYLYLLSRLDYYLEVKKYKNFIEPVL